MTRKDYVLIADAIGRGWRKKLPEHVSGAYTAANIAHSIADALKADNPAFDKQRFLDYTAKKMEGK